MKRKRLSSIKSEFFHHVASLENNPDGISLNATDAFTRLLSDAHVTSFSPRR